MSKEARPRAGLQKAHDDKLSRWTLTISLAFGFVVLILLGNIAAPYLLAGATLEGAVADQLRATAGLAFRTRVSGRFDLLPRPHLVFYETSVADPSGAMSVAADELDGDVRLLPLIVGRIELSSLTLVNPKMTVDLDRRPTESKSFIGRALRATTPQPDAPLGVISLVDGGVTLKSKAFRQPLELQDVNVTIDWRDLDSPASITGSLSLQKTSADVAVWIGRPSNLMRGGRSEMAFHVHSAPLDASATGDLVSAATTAFTGHVSASAPSAAALLGMVGRTAPLPAAFANLSLNSEAAVGIDTDDEVSIDLQNLVLRTDGNAYEGSLAFQSAGRFSLSGTLATEQLMLAPFMSRLPAVRDAGGRWSAEQLFGSPPPPIDLDLRVSANHLRLPPFTIDDAALAIMTRGERTEVALVQGSAYGGTAKGRVSVGIADETVNVRGSGSLNGADGSALTWAAWGRQLAGGSFSASANFETSGSNLAALMRNLQGWAKCTATDGELTGVDLSRALEDTGRRDPAVLVKALRGGRTPFQSLSFGARAVDGLATLEDGAVTTPTAAVKASGNADLGARRLDLQVVATPLGSAKPVPLALDVTGAFDKPTVLPAPPPGR